MFVLKKLGYKTQNRVFMIKTVFASFSILLLAFPLNAEEAPSCPDRGSDPSKFCPVGTVWSEEAKQCLGMV
tara:strand:+ start:172 stop:384 length:213 start_codon:yes stop_codon:yes gene_type:complete